jgi:hypothetical protein
VEVIARDDDEIYNGRNVNAYAIKHTGKAVDKWVAVNYCGDFTIDEARRGCPSGPWADFFDAIHDWRHSIQAVCSWLIILHRAGESDA